MAYVIRVTDPTVSPLGTIADGTFDNRSKTSLQLVGRNYPNYGQAITDNLVSLVENFAHTVAPPNPLAGQIWYSKIDSRLKVWNGTEFKTIQGATSALSAPTTTVAGDFWWHAGNKQLYVYDGTNPFTPSGWILVGPERDNTGAKWEQITDTLSTQHTVVTIYISGTRVGIISNDTEFTPLTPIAGFTTIRPGYNIVSGSSFQGTALNSTQLAGIAASAYLRSDTDDTTSGKFGIVNNSGLEIGLSSNLAIKTETDGTVRLVNQIPDKQIKFTSTRTGANVDVLTLDGLTSQASITSLVITGTAVANSASTGALVVSGGIGVAGKIVVTNGATVSGLLTAVTAPVGTANTMVATTDFVVNNSGLLKNKIYVGNDAASATTYIDVNDTGVANLRMVVGGTTVATGSAGGINLSNGATAVTQPDTYNGSGNSRVATTQFVKTATQWWGGSKKFVSSDPPNPGVNDVGSIDGDFWFQYTP